VLEVVAGEFGHDLKLTRKNIGGAALTASNDPLPPDTLAACLSAGAYCWERWDRRPSTRIPPSAPGGRLCDFVASWTYANLRPESAFPRCWKFSVARPKS